MSHTVTVTRTTTTSSTSAIILNTGYCKTVPGLLKIAQVVGGAIVIGILLFYEDKYYHFLHGPELFFLCAACTFFIASACLLVSCLCSLSTSSIISKTLYEFVYHGVAFLLYLAASLTFLVEVNRNKNNYRYNYNPYFTASIIGVILTILYFISTVLAYRSYRGG